MITRRREIKLIDSWLDVFNITDVSQVALILRQRRSLVQFKITVVLKWRRYLIHDVTQTDAPSNDSRLRLGPVMTSIPPWPLYDSLMIRMVNAMTQKGAVLTMTSTVNQWVQRDPSVVFFINYTKKNREKFFPRRDVNT